MYTYKREKDIQGRQNKNKQKKKNKDKKNMTKNKS